VRKTSGTLIAAAHVFGGPPSLMLPNKLSVRSPRELHGFDSAVNTAHMLRRAKDEIGRMTGRQPHNGNRIFMPFPATASMMPTSRCCFLRNVIENKGGHRVNTEGHSNATVGWSEHPSPLSGP
jgi:hypothetical protein